MVGVAGVTANDTSVAGVMVRETPPDTLPAEAMMIAEPGLTAVASPLEPAALLIPATPLEEFQVTEKLGSCAELSV